VAAFGSSICPLKEALPRRLTERGWPHWLIVLRPMRTTFKRQCDHRKPARKPPVFKRRCGADRTASNTCCGADEQRSLRFPRRSCNSPWQALVTMEGTAFFRALIQEANDVPLSSVFACGVNSYVAVKRGLGRPLSHGNSSSLQAIRRQYRHSYGVLVKSAFPIGPPLTAQLPKVRISFDDSLAACCLRWFLLSGIFLQALMGRP